MLYLYQLEPGRVARNRSELATIKWTPSKTGCGVLLVSAVFAGRHAGFRSFVAFAKSEATRLFTGARARHEKMTTPSAESKPLVGEKHNDHSQEGIHYGTESYHSHHDNHHHRFVSLGEDVPLYCPPKQRQRWGDHYILPHVNWGDLFFDLFYVAAAYNLDGIMDHDPSFRGLLYFVCCYLPISLVWVEKLGYDGKFAPDDNLFHRGWEIAHLGIVGTIVQHVQTVEIMSQTTKYPTTMIFASALCVESWSQLLRYKDVYHNVIGGEEAVHEAQADSLRKFFVSLCFLAAAIIAGFDYFGKPSTQATNDLPVILCGLSYLVERLQTCLQTFYLIPKSGKEFYDVRVPMNLEFALHRLGEWVMLMLGETVLSLLIAPQSKGARYYLTFYTGITAVTLLQYLFFRSQPFAIEDHAGRRSLLGTLIFTEMLTIYSGCLIVFGGAYKLTLDQYVLEETLPPSATVGVYTLAQRRARIANLFCWSLTVSMVALDFMIVTHRGFRGNFARFRNPAGGCNVVPTIILIVSLSLLGFTVTLSMWIHSLEWMSLLGLLVVVFQVLLRTFGLRYFPVSKKAMDAALGRLPIPT